MNTLYELTGKRSGIVFRDGHYMIIDDWTNIHGLPIQFPDCIRGIGEAIPTPSSAHWYDDLSEWVDGINVGDRRPPERGWVYEIDDKIIIAPDEWI